MLLFLEAAAAEFVRQGVIHEIKLYLFTYRSTLAGLVNLYVLPLSQLNSLKRVIEFEVLEESIIAADDDTKYSEKNSKHASYLRDPIDDVANDSCMLDHGFIEFNFNSSNRIIFFSIIQRITW